MNGRQIECGRLLSSPPWKKISKKLAFFSFVFWMGQSAAVTDDELTNGQPAASARSRGNFFFCDQQLH